MSGPNAPPTSRGAQIGTQGDPLRYTSMPLASDVAQYGMPQQSRAAQSAANGGVKPPPGYSPPPPTYPGPGSTQPRPSAPQRQAPSVPPVTPEPPTQAPASPATRGLAPDNPMIPQNTTLPTRGIPLPRPRAAASSYDTFYPPSNADQLLQGLEQRAAAMRGGGMSNAPPVRALTAVPPVSGPMPSIPQGPLTAQALMDAIARRGNLTQSTFPTRMPQAGQPYDPTTGESAAGQTPADAVATRGIIGRIYDQITGGGQAPTPTPTPTPSPTPDVVPPSGKMAFNYFQQRPADTAGKDFPRAVPKDWYVRMNKGQPPVRASISPAVVQRYDEAMRKGKGDKFNVPYLTEKTHTTASGGREGATHSYGPSDFYYKVLGVARNDKYGAARALQALRKKQEESPWMLTRDEDAILAADQGASMEPGAVQQRFQEASKGKAASNLPDLPAAGGTTFIRPKTGTADPAATAVQDAINQAGAPQWQGWQMPTQQDITAGKQDPVQFYKQYPSYQAPSAETGDTADEEE